MRVYAENVIVDFAISRIVNAFKKHSPRNIEFVSNESEADLVIIYAFGQRRKIWWRVDKLIKSGKKYAIVQLCLRSTSNPNTNDWLNIWQGAELVWSYFNLVEMVSKDNEPKVYGMSHLTIAPFNFYYAPLGVDSNVFKETKMDKREITIVYDRNRSESVKEIVKACGGTGYILGQGITDEQLAKVYSNSKFVSGLRKIEGFELPVIEGLLCGARPIIFDRDHYYQWFADFAIGIEEGNSNQIVNELSEVIKYEYRPVTKAEKEFVKKRFNWETIIKGFWEKINV